MQGLAVSLFVLLFVYNFAPLCGAQDEAEVVDPFKWLGNVVRSVRNVLKPNKDVNFYLYTKANPKKGHELITNDVDSVESSYFNWCDPTMIIVHGWMSSSDQEVNTLIRDAYLSTGPHNIITVNWMIKSSGLYDIAAANVPEIGSKVAKFIDFMAGIDYLSPEDVVLIGHSLGAHVCGFAGKNLTSGRLHAIIALDPAAPKFPYDEPDKRLSETDAYYVESIQTNGDGPGYIKPIGRATFYPNGGKKQLGCPKLDPSGSCSHYLAYKFFAEAIRIKGFPSIKCQDYKHAIENNCGDKYSSQVRMGSPDNADCASGVYYVPTKAKAPYAVDCFHEPEIKPGNSLT